jgi:DNA-binding MarR family transcriptional regulator
MSARSGLVAELNAVLRDVSGQGVLFSAAAASLLGVNSTDLEVMGYLTDGPRTAGALAQAAGLTTGAITGVVDRLERAGYARRERDRADRRKVMVRMTDTALERTAPIFQPMEHAVSAALADYDEHDLELLLGFLRRMQRVGAAVLAALKSGPVGQSDE